MDEVSGRHFFHFVPSLDRSTLIYPAGFAGSSFLLNRRAIASCLATHLYPHRVTHLSLLLPYLTLGEKEESYVFA